MPKLTLPSPHSLPNPNLPPFRLSLSILLNLSLNPGLKGLLQTWKPSSSEYSRLASSLICSLVMLDKKKCQIWSGWYYPVAGQGRLGASWPGCPVLSSLAELVQFHGNCILSVRAGAVPVLMQIVESTDGEVLAGTSLAFSVSLLGLMRD